MKIVIGWLRLFTALLFIAALFGSAPLDVSAQNPNCYWKLVSEEPLAIYTSTAPETVVVMSGTTVTVEWWGLVTNHTWTYPGATLIPGDTLVMEVDATWDVQAGSSASNSNGGLATSFYFGNQSVRIGQNQIKFNQERSGSIYNSASFTVPFGSKEGEYFKIYGFADAAVGGGRVDYKYVYFCPTPTPTPTQTETPTPTPTPTETATPTATATTCPALSEEEKYAAIIDLYFEKIPAGIGTSGMKVNINSWIDEEQYGSYVCGSYQAVILRFLDKLKFSENPCERALLDKWDYGPIEAWWGYHQAVVLYPWATNWMETGTVLDPWIEQKPQIYTIQNWSMYFSGPAFAPFVGSGYTKEEQEAASFRGIGPSAVYSKTGNYPIFGGDYTSAGYEIDLTADENAYIQRLPEEKKAIFRRMTKNTQKEYLKMKLAGVEKVKRVIADCPLQLHLEGPDGARSGVSGSQLYNELPGVSFMALPLEDGTIVTEMLYPEGAGYKLVLEATGRGEGLVWLGEGLTLTEGGETLQQYRFDVEKDAVYEIASDQPGAPMTWEGGSLQPQTISSISDELLASLPDLDAPGAENAPKSPAGERETNPSGAAASWQPGLGGMLFVFGSGVTAFIGFAVLLIVMLARRKKAAGLPPRRTPVVQWIMMIGLFLVACPLSTIGSIGMLRALNNAPGEQQETKVSYVVILPAETPTAQATPARATAPQPTRSQVQITATPGVAPTQTSQAPGGQTGGLTGRQALDDHRLFDDFSSKALGWPEGEEDGTVTKYENGGYSLQVLTPDDLGLVFLPAAFNPSEIAFDVTPTGVLESGTVGVMCQYQDAENYYYVEFDLDTRSYVIAQYLAGEYVALTAEQTDGQYWHDLPSLPAGTAKYHMSIGCYPGSVFVMVNDEVVDNVMTDTPFSKGGSTAFFIYTYPFAGDEGYKVIFDNVEAYIPAN